MTAWTPDEKARAVEVYVEHGLARAHAETGASKPSLRRWALDAGHDPAEIAERTNAKNKAQTARATAATKLRWAERRTTLLEEYGAAAEDFLRAALDSLDAGKALDAFTYMKTSGTACDKAQVLSGDASSIVRIPWDPDAVIREATPRADHLRSVG